MLKGAITLFWVNTKRKTVMTLIRIVLLNNGCAVITLFKIYLKRAMTDPFTFECHYSLLDYVKLKLQSWLSFGVTSIMSVLSWLSLGTTFNPSVLPLLSFRTCLSFGTKEYLRFAKWVPLIWCYYSFFAKSGANGIFSFASYEHFCRRFHNCKSHSDTLHYRLEQFILKSITLQDCVWDSFLRTLSLTESIIESNSS